MRTMRLRQRLHRRTDDQGFSMVEVIIAMVVFAVMVSAALGIIVQTFDVTRDNANRVAAANLATKQIESARSQLAINIADGASSRTEIVAGTAYTITQNANYVVSGSDSSLCDNTGGQLAYKLVTVTVTWPNMGSIQPVRSDTVKALGVGDEGLDEALGAVAIGVSGRTGDPVAGVTVTLMPGGLTRTTGVDGCAVFVNLPVATGGSDFTASVNQFGYVSPQNNQYQQVVVGAVAGEVKGADLRYDSQRSLTVDVVAPPGYTVPAAGFPVGIRSSDIDAGTILPSCAVVTDAGCATAAPGAAQHLFPAIYDVWAGDCPSPRPIGSTGNVDLTAADGAVVVPVEGALVKVVDSFGAPVAGYTVTATPDPVGGCTSATTYNLPATGVDGSKGALPAGEWTITVTSPGGTTSQQPLLLVPGGAEAAHTVTFAAVTP